LLGLAGCFAVWREEFVEQWDGRVRVDGRAGVEGFVPAGLERSLEVVAHAVGGLGVEPAHARHLVAEAPFGEDLGDAVRRSRDCSR
jgi:hypothetical protein